jgi:hypothetical protein
MPLIPLAVPRPLVPFWRALSALIAQAAASLPQRRSRLGICRICDAQCEPDENICFRCQCDLIG